MKQSSFSDMAYDQKKKKTRKERFLGEMDAVLPWDLLLSPILEHYPKAGGGRRPIGAPVMLRIYFMQQWYGLSDPAMEDSLYDVESMRRFAGVDLGGVPDETTICKFRHLLEAHGLTEALFDQTKRYLSDRGMMVSEGTIVDATIIHAPSSTKNKEGKRDPEMALREEGQHLALRHEGPRGQRSEGTGAQRGGHARLGPRRQGDGGLHAWTGKSDLRRQGLCGPGAKAKGRRRRYRMAGASQGQ